MQGGNVSEPISDEQKADPPADGNVDEEAEMQAPKRKLVVWDMDYKEQETSKEKQSADEQRPPFQVGEGSSSSSSGAQNVVIPQTQKPALQPAPQNQTIRQYGGNISTTATHLARGSVDYAI